MPLNSRDLWLVLKAQDQTNRALNTFARNVKNAGDTVRMAQLQAERAATLGAIAQAKLANEVQRAAVGQDAAQQAVIRHSQSLVQNRVAQERATIAQLAAQKAALQSVAASMAGDEAKKKEVKTIKTQASAIGDEITKRKMLIGQMQSEIAAQQGSINSIQGGVTARKTQMAANDSYIASQKKMLAGIDDEIKRVEASNKSAQEHEKHLARLSGSMQQVSQTATAMGFALTGAGVMAAIGIKQAIDTAVEYERQVRMTATQVDGFSGNLQELGDIGRKLANEIAVPFEQIQPALFDIFSSMEVNTKDAEKLLQSFSKAAVAGQVDIQDVSRATIGLLNAFQRPASDVNKLLDIQFQLVQEGVGTYEEWNQRIGLVTPSAVRAGQSIEVMMAALAASTRMGMSAARSGTAVARSFDALSNPKTVSNLKALGVSVQDAQGKFRPFNEVLRDFRNVLNKMPEKDRLSTILDVFKGAGGTIEARRFLQNVLLGAGNLEMFDNILKETSNSAGSMESAYQIMSKGVAAQTQLLKNQWSLLKESVGKSLMPMFASLVGWLARLLQKFNELGPHGQKVIAVVAALVSIFAAVMGPLLLIIGAVAAVVAAFAVAGSAIAIVVGILAGFVAIGAVAAAVFALLWQKSDGFRAILAEAAKRGQEAFGILSDGAKALGAAFRDRLEGPLSKLWEVINTKVLPAVLALYKVWGDTLLPKLKEAMRIIVDVYDQGFKRLGAGIEDYVIPAIEKMVGWWEKHKEAIKPVLSVIAQVIKWLLIIAAVITGVVVVALVAILAVAIGLVIAVFAALGLAVYYAWQGLKWLWDQIVTFAKWLGGVFVSAWNAVVDAVVAAWNWLGDFFSGIWGGITGAFSAALQWISDTWSSFTGWLGGLWQSFWGSTIGQFLIAVFQTLVASVQLGWAAIQFVFQWGMKYISDGWNTLWGWVSSFFSTVWDGISAAARNIWMAITAIWGQIWPPVRDFFVNIWTAISGFAVGIWNSIKNGASAIFHGMANILSDIWNGIKSAASSIWNGIYSGIVNPIIRAYDYVVAKMKGLQDFFNAGGHWLYDAGEKIINGLIEGMTKKLHELEATMNKITSIIKDHLPGSPVKKGPLKVLNHGYAGGQIVTMIADGMARRLDQLNMASDFMGTTVAAGLGSSLAQNPSTYSGERVVTQTINVYTQEIDPKKNSAELGFELVKVL